MWRAGRAPRSERSRPFPAPPPSCTCLEKMVRFFFFRCEFRKFRSSTTNQRQREVPTEEDAEEVEGRGRWSKGENQHDGWRWWRWEQLWGGRKLWPRTRRPITARRHNRRTSNLNSYSVSLIILVQTLWWIYVYFFHLLFCQNYRIFLSSTSGGSPPSFSFTLRHYWILVSKNLRACGR